MTPEQIQKKLNLIAKHINELDAALKEQHGASAFVFFEAEGSIYAMSGDADYGIAERQKHIIASSKYTQFGCGAW